MRMVVMPLVLLLTTAVTMVLLWLVIVTGHVPEMVTALLVLLMERLQLVNVSV